MKVFYSPYTLTPLKRANRLSSLDKKKGVLVKAVLGKTVTFADYFPHLPLGDRSFDQFLSEFKFQKQEYDQKIFDFLLKDKDYQKLKPKKFFNHQLWTGSEPFEAKTVKYKLLHPQDRSFLIPLREGLRVRLDGNALFTRKEYLEFLKTIPDEYHAQFDYMEDPLSEKDWSGLKLPSAMDFIEGDPYQYYIYKPNCEFRPKTEAKIIFSGYLGGDLGRWHSYCELIASGDLTTLHGIVAFDFHQGEKQFLTGSFKDGFIGDLSQAHDIYHGISGLEWKSLCSM